METHYNGVNTIEELETLVSDLGVLFREYRGDGYLVVGEDDVFIVKNNEYDESVYGTDSCGFVFSEVNSGHITEIRTETRYPRLKDETVGISVSEESRRPCTLLTIWTTNHPVEFYVDAPVQKVSAAFVRFRTQ